MRKIDLLLAEYGESHQNDTNKFIHWICVPAIFFSAVGLVASIPADSLRDFTGLQNHYVNWALVVLIPVMAYYFHLSKSLGLGMLLFCALCLIGTVWLDQMTRLWMVSLIIFITAWVLQLYGHKVEGKKPSFFKDLQFLLIGPAWLLHFIYKKVGIGY
jgi:uncharacterized membrane protein YGL010W